MADLGDAQVLMAAYDRWKALLPQDERARTLRLPLHYSKGLSSDFTKAHGNATVDLVIGSFSVNVSGLSDKATYDVWLIDNRGGHSVAPEEDDARINVGTLSHREGSATLQGQLNAEALRDFELDLVVVSPTAKPLQQRGFSSVRPASSKDCTTMKREGCSQKWLMWPLITVLKEARKFSGPRGFKR